MSKSGEAFEKLTYEEIRSMTLKEVGERLDNKGRVGFNQLCVVVYNEEIEALKCGVMPK